MTISGGEIQNGSLSLRGLYTNANLLKGGLISASITGSGWITQQSGTTTFTGANSSSGPIAISGGRLMIGTGGRLGSGDINNNAILEFSGSDSKTVSNVISGTGALVQSGSGIITLTGGNSYSGITSINNGVLMVGTGGVLGSGLIINNATLGFGGSDSQWVSNAISGTGVLIQSGTGSTTIYGANSYSGGTIINGGVLSVSVANNLGAGGVSVNANGTLNVTAAMTLTTSISGSGNMVKNGAGNLVLQGVNDFSGFFTVNSGGLIFDGVDAENGAASINLNGGSLMLGASYIGNIATIGSLSGNKITSLINASYGSATGTRFLSVNQSVDGVYVGKIEASSGARTIGLIKSGSATLTLSGTNTYTGGTTINEGTLLAGSNSAFSSGTVTVNNGGTLNLGLAGSPHTIGNSITVNNGGVLKGVGTLGGTVNFVAGAVFAPGNSPGIGMISGSVMMASGAAYQWEIQGASPSVAGTDFDQIQVINGGMLTIQPGAVLQISGILDYSGVFWNSNRDFLIADAQNTGTISGGDNFTLNTSSAGVFAGRGVWSVNSINGDIYAHWTAIPEPSAYGLFGAGLVLGLRAIARRNVARRKNI